MTAAAKKSGWSAPIMPAFFDPKNAAKWGYRPDIAKVFDEAMAWKKAGAVQPAAADRKKVHALFIDVQKDFCFPEGTLYVAGRSGTGAIDDSRRMAEWIYANLPILTHISCTLDTHIPFQIFSRSFWEKADGTPVAAHTVITAAEVKDGTYKPSLAAVSIVANGNYQWLLKQCIHYCEELEKAGKYKLYIWPEHCLLGTSGHSLVGVLEEAGYFHAFARGSQLDFQIKGGNPLTENYSVMKPEVLTRWDGAAIPGVQKNTKLLEALFKADYIPVFGQALSHCVKSSVDDLLDWVLAQDPALARKVYIVADCMSAVTVPDGKGGFLADFTPEGEAALKKFSDAGMHVVNSTDPVTSWPDFVL